ncbi:MAG: prolipoprotein diacylglyceryl transferase [Acidobacteria bacterium]|nr:prolipoprotein diacylglyceryl transferase [Acidobacteriota bacterium]
MYPKLFTIGDYVLPTYGLLVVTGMMLGLYAAGKLAAREGLAADRIFNLGIYLALAGIIGSKLALIAQDWDYFGANPARIFSMSTLQSGGIFYGGLIASILTAVYLTRKYDLSFLRAGDVLMPGVALGLGLGRLGCFSAGCCWGKETDAQWGVTYTNSYSHETVGVPLNVALHPTQIYESVLSLAIFAFLWHRHRHKKYHGEILGWYLLLGPASRFVVELARHHSEEAWLFGHVVSDAQGISVMLFLFGAWLLWLSPYRRRALRPA